MKIFSTAIYDLLHVHPPHTLVNHFPIALISAGLFFILLALWRKSDLLENVAFADFSLGSVSTLVAGIFGIRDNLVFYNGGAPNHNLKIILASALFVITAATALLRWRYPKAFHNSYKWLYFSSYVVSFLVVAVLGYLGGVILFGG